MPSIFNAKRLKFERRPIPVPEFAWSISEMLSEKCDSKRMHFNFVSLEKGKFSYPYHFHRNTEELFVVVSGKAILRSPVGFTPIGPGDVVFMEMGERGAHQLYNSEDEPCLYLDIRIRQEIDVVDYPDSGKVNILPFLQVFKNDSKVSYFEGERDVKSLWPQELIGPQEK